MPLLRSLYLFLFCALSHSPCFSQTCFGSEQLSSQADVEAFAAMNCEHLNGNLHIIGTVNDLTPLSNLKTITGYLWIAASDLYDLEGLNNLDSVGDFLRIYYNDSLTSLTGFEKLRKVNAYIDIQANNELESIASFDALEYTGYIRVRSNPNLEHLGTFPKLDSIRNFLELEGDSIREVIGFNALRSVISMSLGGPSTEVISGFNKLKSIPNLNFRFYPELHTISGFQQLERIQSKLEISSCPRLETFPSFDALLSADIIQFQSCPLQVIPGFSNLDSLGGLSLEFMPILRSLPAFPALRKLGGLGLIQLDSMRSIDHFHQIPNLNVVNIRQMNALESIHLPDGAEEMDGVYIVFCPVLTSFEGFGQVKVLNQLQFYDCELLSEIPDFNNLITAYNSIDFYKTGITRINGFENVERIGSQSNPPGDGLRIEDCTQITSITGFNNLANVYSCRLNSLPQLDSLHAFTQLSTVERTFLLQGTKLISLDAFSAMRQIGGRLEFYFNPLLENLTGLDSLDVPALDQINIEGNKVLSACNTHLICSAFEHNTPMEIKNNGYACNSEFDIRQGCDGIYSHIYATVFYDLDQDGGKGVAEPLFPMARIHIDPLDIDVFNYHDRPLTYFTDFGNYRVSAAPIRGEDWKSTSTVDTVDVTLTEAIPGDSLQFGFYPDTIIDRVECLQTSSRINCNLHASLYTTILNTGTTLTNGILWISVDDNAQDIIFRDADYQAGNLTGYTVENLFPGHRREYTVRFTTPGPEIFPLGDSLHFTAWFENTTGDTMAVAQYDPVVLCSYDPNDKITNPSREYGRTRLDEDLYYTIRFENTGNLEATDIVIVDTLDANIDPESIVIIASSHLNRLTTSVQDNALTFYFKNIYLPYFEFEPGDTQGFVSFSAKPKRPVVNHTVISNTASIYFDLNPPIVTNTVRNWYTEEFIEVCQLSPGRDTLLCVDPVDGVADFSLGGTPVQAGGLPPYTYEWTTSTQDQILGHSASLFLSDTAIANPTLLGFTNDDITFHVLVTDSIGNVCTDSVAIGFSVWYEAGVQTDFNIELGDSCLLIAGFAGGTGMLAYNWTPVEGVVNPNSSVTWAKPLVSTTYTVVITDEIGCEVTETYHVEVEPVGIPPSPIKQILSKVKPNPVHDIAQLELSTLPLTGADVEIWNSIGQLSMRIPIVAANTAIDVSALYKGIHFYTVISQGQIISHGRFVVE